MEDISSEDHEFQRRHVLETLNNLAIKIGSLNKMNEMISVANKSDLIDLKEIKDPHILPISAETGLGNNKSLQVGITNNLSNS